jgi:Zn-dependent metalloprotease
LSLSRSFEVARVGLSERLRAQPYDRPGGSSLGAFLLTSGGTPNITIYDAHNSQRLPGTPVQSAATPASTDPAVIEAYEYMGDSYDFYWQVFERDSLDGAGLALNGSVHFDNSYDNAYWDGQRMVYGDGDGQQFGRFTQCVDVIGHELTHGVTQNESGLIYWAQTGALNESISDVFGSLIKQYFHKQTVDQADWLIGTDIAQGTSLFLPGVDGTAIRSLSAPGTAYDDPVLGKDPQPSTMTGYVYTLQDNAGVHINSGIPNHAFYLAATNLGGYAWESAGAIWYAAATSPLLRSTARFDTFARLTLVAAQQLYGGPNAAEVEVVREAWANVGIRV